jgi:hypothetical protein
MSDFAIPSPKLKDSIFLTINLIPLGISAALRALFWVSGLPFAIWTRKWSELRWEDDFVTVLPLITPGKSGQRIDSAKLDTIRQELLGRNAHHFPHAGGRHFSQHIEGMEPRICCDLEY